MSDEEGERIMESERMEEDVEQEEEEKAAGEDTATTTTKSAAVVTSLSKSWSVRTSHEPLFTGGKLTHCHTAGLVVADNTNSRSSVVIPFMLLPVGGDVSLVDTRRGVSLGTVRNGGGGGRSSSSLAVNDDDDEDGDDEDQGGRMDGDAITAHALSANDQMILTCSRNSLLRQYSTETTTSPSSTDYVSVSIKLVKNWGKSGHTLPVTEMALHTSSIFLATGSIDGSARVWDVRGAYVTHVFRPAVGGASGSGGGGGGGSARRSVTALQWLPKVEQLVLAIGRDDGSVSIHNLRDNNKSSKSNNNSNIPVIVLCEHVSVVTCMEWNAAANLFVTASRDAVLCLWKVVTSKKPKMKNNKKKKSKKNKKSDEDELDEEEDGGGAAVPTVSYERMHTLPIYEQVEGMALLNNINCNMNNAASLVVATAGSRGQVRLWGVTTSAAATTAVTVTAAKEHDEKMRLYPLAEQPLSESFGEARGGYMALAYIATSSKETDEEQQQQQQQQQQLVVADAEHNVSFLSLSSDDAGLEKPPLLATDRTIVGHNDDILDLKVIPNSSSSSSTPILHNKIVVATNSSKVRLFDLSDFSSIVLDRHSATVLCVDVSACGRFIATCGKDKQVRLWYLMSSTTTSSTTCKCVAVAEGHTEAVGAVALSRKAGRYDVTGKAARNGAGAFMVTASIDRTLKRWNLPGASVLEENATADGDEELSLNAFVSVRAHEKDINNVAVAPNDSLIATGSQDKTVKLWKASDLSLRATLKGHRRGVWDCQFSPFDRVLATASGDRTIKLWSLSDYSCLRTFQGHLSSVLRIRFLTGGLQLVSSGADGLVKLWTIRNNECEATMDGHNDKVWALDLSPDGKSMVSGGADSTLLVWEDTTQQVIDAKQAEEEEAILMDQKLANHLRHNQYAEALEISLKRDKPHQTLKVLTALMEVGLEAGGSSLDKLKQLAENWTTERIVQVLRYCREWNTRARTSNVAMATCKAVLTTFPAHKLASIDGLAEILAGTIPYAERHYDRLDRLYTSSYLLDFVLGSMGSLEADEGDNDFAEWESKSRLVLPPKIVDGRIQVGGNTVIGAQRPSHSGADGLEDSDEVMTVGESDSDDDDDEEEEEEEGADGQ